MISYSSLRIEYLYLVVRDESICIVGRSSSQEGFFESENREENPIFHNSLMIILVNVDNDTCLPESVRCVQ
jgi:hypothetical protein